jgi:hypothetical protein
MIAEAAAATAAKISDEAMNTQNMEGVVVVVVVVVEVVLTAAVRVVVEVAMQIAKTYRKELSLRVNNTETSMKAGMEEVVGATTEVDEEVVAELKTTT